MKNTTITYIKRATYLMVFLFGLVSYSQDIHFTFANAQNTNDGSNDFYEVDVMMQTINGTGSFKLGSGQLYFNYNTAAFGDNVFDNARIEVTQDNVSGYVAGQHIDAAAAFIYNLFTSNDNTNSRVSWAFSQNYSSSTFASDNINASAVKLCHIKIQYMDVNQDAMFMYEDGAVYDDQFYTACGPETADPFESANCGANPGIQLLNDTFDSSGGEVLSISDELAISNISIHPNPTSKFINITSTMDIESVELYNLLGKRVLSTTETEQIRVDQFSAGIYLLKIYTQKGKLTKKVIIE